MSSRVQLVLAFLSITVVMAFCVVVIIKVGAGNHVADVPAQFVTAGRRRRPSSDRRRHADLLVVVSDPSGPSVGRGEAQPVAATATATSAPHKRNGPSGDDAAGPSGRSGAR
jgi:hypothetical protein